MRQGNLHVTAASQSEWLCGKALTPNTPLAAMAFVWFEVIC